MCAGIILSRRKKIFLFGVFLLTLLGIGLFLFFHTPLPINLLGIYLVRNSGIELNAKGFILKPGLKGTIEHLSLSGGEGIAATALMERVDFNGRIVGGLKAEITDITIHNPSIGIDINPDSKKTSHPYEGSLKPPRPFQFLKGLTDKVAYIEKMDINGGSFSFKLPNDTGILKLTDTYIKIREMGKYKGGAILLKGSLYACPFSHTYCSPGEIELSLSLKALSPVLSGSGHLTMTLPELITKGAIFKDIQIGASIDLDSGEIRLQGFSLVIKGLEYEGESIAVLKDINCQCLVVYDLQEDTLYLKAINAELPKMGILKGDLKMELPKGFSWQGSFWSRDFLLSGLPEILAPLLELDQRGWTLDGRGGLKAELNGEITQKGLAFRGVLELEVKGAGFASPDGTKAGEGIEGSIVLNLAHPQKERDKIQFETEGKLVGGEYLWGAIYRDLSGHSLTWALKGFFL